MMHWNDFLSANGAQLKDGQVKHFGSPENEAEATLHGNIIADLSHLSIVEITGQDAEEFLHGQFTNDLKTLDKYKLQSSAWCNAKGQVLANFYIFKHNAGLTLLLPTDLKSKFIKRLQMFVLMSDVIINDKSNELGLIGISINKIIERLNIVIDSIPEEPATVIETENYTCIRIFDSNLRIILIGTTNILEKNWSQLTACLVPVGTLQWELLDILSGFPWVTSACTEKFLPQYLNMDLLGGLSYDKGCYPGQEVIARLHYRGKIKRRLFLADSQQPSPPTVGDAIYAGNKNIGSIINVQPHPEFGYLLLAVIEIDKVRSESVTINNIDGSILSIHELPYSLNA